MKDQQGQSGLSAINACFPHAHVGVAAEEGACIAAGEVACAAACAPVSADTGGGFGLSAAQKNSLAPPSQANPACGQPIEDRSVPTLPISYN
jgi:hypothetical protein